MEKSRTRDPTEWTQYNSKVQKLEICKLRKEINRSCRDCIYVSKCSQINNKGEN